MDQRERVSGDDQPAARLRSEFGDLAFDLGFRADGGPREHRREDLFIRGERLQIVVVVRVVSRSEHEADAGHFGRDLPQQLERLSEQREVDE